MKRLFIIGVLIMSLLTGTMLFSTTAIALLGEDGLVMPESSGVTQSLRSGEEYTLGLVPVNYEDTVYSSLSGYYVGNERIAIDRAYPVFIHGGAGLRFLDEETWLFSADVDLVRSFEGMYLNDGTTYNSDLSQADGEEFILLVLSNGLHMNAQRAVLANRLSSTVIPANSILYFSDDALRWYSLDNQSLIYGEETALFDAVITIGAHTYNYYDLLKAIGVLHEAIDKLRDGKEAEEEINEIMEIIADEAEENQHERHLHSGSSEAVDNQQPPTDSIDTPERFGENQTTGGEKGRTDTSRTDPIKREDGTSTQGEAQQKEHTGSLSENVSGNQEKDDKTDSEQSESDKDSESGGSSGSAGSGSSGSGSSGGGSSSSTSGGGGSSSGHSNGGSSGNSGGSHSGSTEGENTGAAGQNDPGSGGEQGSGGAMNPDAGTGESGTGEGASGPPAYRDPVVTLTNLEAWSYALYGKLTITDPANTVIKGARISIYRGVDGRGATSTDENGHTVYPADSYEGKTALLRKTYSGTQEFAMATLPPDTEIYVQYTFRYNAQVETDEDELDGSGNPTGNKVKETKRLTITSDIIKLKTPDNAGIAPVAATWEECFAVLDKDIRLDALKLRNTTDYNADTETFAFENFKKDTLTYVNRLEFTLTPVNGGETVVLSTNSSVLREAKTEGGASFTSSGGKLQPSTQYRYTVRAVDRYGNSMPLMANGSDSFQSTLYTCKTAPTAQIEEIANVTDQLTLKVTLNDPSNALLPGRALKLTVVDSSGVEAELYGTWENGDKFGAVSGSSSITALELAEPASNKTYTFTIDSLAFAKSYTVRVNGSYDPQPTGVAAPRLDLVTDALLGTARSYTASLSTGSIQFSTVTSELSDTYATLGFTMNKNTTVGILPIVDAFKLTVSDAHDDAVLTTTLTLDELDTTEYEYDNKTGSVVLQEANTADRTPRVELAGDENQFAGRTLWEALLLQAYQNAEGGTAYSSPVQLRVSMTEGTLETSTTYQMTMESLVYKSGIEYQVPTSLTTDQFRTKKVQPKLQFEDFFVGGDVAQFIDLRIFDQDETIQQGGLVYVDLYFGETLLSTQEIYATSDPEGGTMDLVFENIIPNAAYTVVFRAAAYNDGGGFSANKQLWIFKDFLGGSGLSGKLTLEGLEYTSTRSVSTMLVRFTGEEAAEKIESETWTRDTANARIKTERFALPEDATFVRVDDLGYGNSSNSITFYAADGRELKWYASLPWRRAGSLLTGVPEGAVGMEVYLSSEDSVKTRGLQIEYYTTPQENLVTAADTLIPVQPGDLLCLSPNAGAVTLYNEAKITLGSISSVSSAVFVVPERASYILLASGGAYKVASAEQEQGYTAEVSAVVEDSEGYLAKLTETPCATVSVYLSENIVDAVYDSEPILTQVMELMEQENGIWTASMVQLLERLEAGCSYQMVLTAEYRGSMVKLDTITFRTDGIYFTISNEDELEAVNQNCYANYIVVEDFTVTRAMNIQLHGTIDFQGHVITNQAPTQNLFSCVYQDAEVRNLVVEYPENADIKAALFEENRGTVDNLIVRTNGTHTTLNAFSMVILYNRGTVRNFILRLGGDLYLSSDMGDTTSIVAYRNMFGAQIENGYIYGANGAGIVFERGQGGYNGGVLIGSPQYGTIRNVFTRMDIWFPTEESGTDDYSIGLLRSLSGTFENIYHVGDYYLLGSEGQKNLSYRIEKERFFHADSSRSTEALWHISQYSYSANQANLVSLTAPAILYDAAWQQQVLGDGFDVEGCVSMGFYPRLKLSACMQKYQEYLPLPTLYGDMPKLVGDGMAEGFVQGNEVGAILLRFQNERGLSIRSVTINGLQVNQIHAQERAEDGLWDVIVDVTALEFCSAYQVTGFTYLNGTAVQSVLDADYTTTGIEFWKEVDSLTDWRDINDHMDWNYRLTADLDFNADTLLPSAIMLNGSKTDLSKTVKFTGKLDGSYYENGERKLHTIRSLKLVDTIYPYVIYRMGSGSVLSNLVIENMTLTASNRSSSKYAGFVAYVESVSIENVHIRDSEFRGVGSMGTLLGETSTYAFSFRDCSVADTLIFDAGTGVTVYAGGLAGKLNYGNIESCYARNIELSVQNSSTVGGVGGLLGYNEMNTLRNCYSTGSIYATASQVGGIFGYAETNSRVVTCWSSMDLFVTGDYVGSIGGGYSNHQDNFLLGVGNISASGEHAGRLFGESGFANAERIGYAFAGQTVTGMAAEENGDVTGLLTSQQLGRRSTWTDLIRMGPAFEYDSLANGYFPKVFNRDGTLVWGQENIPIPGLGSDHFITLQSAVFDEHMGRYYIIGQWTHPGYTTEQLAAALEKGLVTEELSIVLDGLGLTDEHILSGRASITLSYAGEGKSNLSITCSDLEKALDTYTLTVKYGGISIQTDIDFGEPLYHEVPDLATWNELMKAGHGSTRENFRITGEIDFEGADTAYKNLKLGRLEGVQKGMKVPCFCNMNYRGSYSGSPWIESVSGGITGVEFKKITADFSEIIESAKRTGTGLILSASSVMNCGFEEIYIGCNGYSSDSIGFFSTVNGTISNITMKTMSLSTENARSGSYGGALAGYVHGEISDLTAEDIIVSLPKTSYTGGIVGYKDRTTQGAVTRITLRNIRVEGEAYVGSLMGWSLRSITKLTLEGFTVKADRHAGGLTGYAAGNITDVTLENGSVTTTSTANKTYYTGGVVGTLPGGYTLNNVLVQGVKVTGNQHTGGLLGRGDCGVAKNIQILGCTVISNGDFTNASAGGIFGHSDYTYSSTSSYLFEAITIRDTDIRAVFAAGGIGGKAVKITANRCYIAEDVTVTAVGSSVLTSGSRIDGCAGGVFGEIQYPLISRVACGARITGARNVGGLLGELDWTTSHNAEIIRSYYVGTVTATQEAAAGVIGYVDGSGVALTQDHVNGVLVAGTITTPGNQVSLLTNQKVGLVPDGKIGVWDNTVLNGQTVVSITGTSAQTGASKTTLPESGTLYTAAQFKEWPTYTAMGFTETDVKFTADDAYMPFVYDTGKKLLSHTTTYNGENTGILKPLGGGNPDTTVVYASDVNAVNIEVSAEMTSVTVNGVQYEPNQDGVVTLSYDFEEDLTVDGVPYSAEDLRRTVMTCGDYWYYMEDGAVYYGTGKQETSKPTVAGIHAAVHLWQGQVICSDGRVYTLNGGTATENADARVVGISQLDDAKPFWSYTFHGVQVDVYHDFTLYAGERVDYRMFEMDGKLYSVSPYQGMVYDGVMLSTYQDNVNAAKRYYALLGREGSLINYLTAWEAQSFQTGGIAHISNNLGYDGQIVVARYRDGSAAGYDYLKGELLFSTTPTVTSFRLYAGNQLRNLFSSFFGGGNPVATDESYALSEEAINETPAELLDGSNAPGNAETDGTGQTGDFIAQADGAVGEGDGGNDADGTSDGAADGANTDGGTEKDGCVSDADGESTADGGGTAADGLGESGTAVDEDGMFRGGDGMGGESERRTLPDDGNSDESGESGEADTASDTYYVPGMGIVENGVVTWSEASISYARGKGVYVEDELIYVESSASGLSAELEGQQAVKLVTPEECREQVIATISEMIVAYDPVAGVYTAMSGAELLGDAKRTPAESAPYYAEDLQTEAADAHSSTLEIGMGFGRTLTESEQNGFVLFAVLMAAAGVLLVLIYLRIVRRRR